MTNSLERIQARILEIKGQIADLRIAERVILALDDIPAEKAEPALEPKARRKPGPKAKTASASKPAPKATRRERPTASEPAEGRQTLGAVISEVLAQQEALSATDIAERIKATGRDVNNRSVSFALQALKKQGRVKNTGGKWAVPKTRGRRARPSPEVSASETEPAT